MAKAEAGERTSITLGFLTVVEHEQHGFFGGYLLLNASARPLEFHCTAPIKPNRAQEILYGPTLRPYLYGEQIAHTLISKSTAKPVAVCTDEPAVLAVRELVSLPVALVGDPASAGDQQRGGPAAGRSVRIDAAHQSPRLVSFELGRNRLAVAAQYEGDRDELGRRLTSLADHLDLAEPFERIRGAIDEAQRAGK
ncbi:MAG TPA: hypothetical protein VG826_12060 [Pirellulales bacterium]|nr:hypothetical protein [Pirellulales bacterium]